MVRARGLGRDLARRLALASAISLLAETKFSAIESAGIGRLMNFEPTAVASIGKSLGPFTQAYEGLMHGLDDFALQETISPIITEYAPFEVYREARVLASLSVNEDEAEDTEEVAYFSDEVDGLVSDFNAELLAVMRGARAAITSNNPDRVRHVISALCTANIETPCIPALDNIALNHLQQCKISHHLD